MPPRYAYWTIIVDDQPTAFRSGAKEDLLPTFNRLKQKSPTAVMMWFQNGKLWPSRLDAQEAMRARGEMGRRGDSRQAGGFRERHRVGGERKDRGERPEWKPKTFAAEGREPRRSSPASEGGPKSSEKLDWKPKGEFTPAPKRAERTERPERSERPDWKPKGAAADRDRKPRSFARPDWKPSGDDTRSAKPEWKPKGSFDRKPDWKPKASFDRDRKPEWKPKTFAAEGREPRRGSPASEGGPKSSEKLDWKPKGEFTPAPKRSERADRPDWKSKTSGPRDSKTSWKPKGSFDRERKPDWKPKGSFDRERKPEWKPRSSRSEKPEWKARTESGTRDAEPGTSAKRKWVPKEEYKKSMGIEAKRDAKWRPGGEHRDPRQKYKDAKKAKWTKFKKTIRTKWESKGKKKS